MHLSAVGRRKSNAHESRLGRCSLFTRERDGCGRSDKTFIISHAKSLYDLGNCQENGSRFPDPFVARVLLQTYYGRVTGRFARAVCS